MSKKPETIFKEKIVKELNKIPHSFIVKIQQVGLRGTPDLFCCISGAFVAIELKSSSKGKVSALQEYNLNLITEAGGIAIVASPENADKVLNYLKRFAAHAAKDKTKKERIQ